MKYLSTISVCFVAIQHVLFMILEMFLWVNPIGMKIFGTTEEFATATKVLAANQGLYNGFLAVGLIWGLLTKKHDVIIFVLGCVVLAGVFGAYTTSNTAFIFVQSAPACLALLFNNKNLNT